MARNKYPEVTVNRILDTALRLFLEQGYEHTTIQDIVDGLGGLSKGAIYHHFKSKEEIIEAVAGRLYGGMEDVFSALLDDPSLNGLEKLRRALSLSLENPNQVVFMQAAPNFLKNPRFLAQELTSALQEVAPRFLAPVIRQGMEDGSIHTDSPEELAEILLLICDIWINPMVFTFTSQQLASRLRFAQRLLEQLGAPVLSDAMLERIEEYRALIAPNALDESLPADE